MPRNKRVPLDQEQVAQAQVDVAINRLQNGNKFLLRACQLMGFLLILATSLASLISLGAHLLASLGQPNSPDKFPTEVNLSIIVFLVVAFDFGMLYAATMIRINNMRGFPIRASALYIVVVTGVAILEAGTYIYMMYLYEKPDNWLAWTLVIGRGLAVPLLAVFLSMAQPITIQTEDISHLTEVFSGLGVLHSIVSMSNRPNTPVGKQILIYRAAGRHSAPQQQRLAGMYAAVTMADEDIVFVDADQQLTIRRPTSAPPAEPMTTNEPDAFALAQYQPDTADQPRSDFILPHTDQGDNQDTPFVVYTSSAPADAQAPHMAPTESATGTKKHNVVPLQRMPRPRATTTTTAANPPATTETTKPKRTRKATTTPAE